MEQIDRRSVLVIGAAAAAATPLLFLSRSAGAAAVPNYGPNDGMDIGAGRRMIDVGVQESQITAYKSLKIIDIVYPVGAADPDDDAVMESDMVCHIIAGEFRIQKPGIPPYIVKDGDIYTCGIGKKDKATNISNIVGIHRIALLLPA